MDAWTGASNDVLALQLHVPARRKLCISQDGAYLGKSEAALVPRRTRYEELL